MVKPFSLRPGFHGSSSKTGESSSKTGEPPAQEKTGKEIYPIVEVFCKTTPTFLHNSIDEFVRAPKGSDAAVREAAKIELALTHGSDPNLSNSPLFSHLSKAIIHDRPWLFRKLLKHPKIDINQEVGGYSPLYHAIQKGNAAAFQTLLKKNAYVSQVAIFLAAMFGQPEMVRTLFAKLPEAASEADVLEATARRQQQTIQTWRNLSAEERKNILWDSLNENISINERLLKIRGVLSAGADPNTRFDQGNTPLHIAATKQYVVRVLRHILVMGADPNSKNDQGDTPLLTATKENKLSALEILLRAGADPNLANNRDETPLAWAIHHNNEASIKALREAGADPNRANPIVAG